MKKKSVLGLIFLAALLNGAIAWADGFSFNAISNRILTPNGDGKNDTFAVSFFNPLFSDISGRVYDLRGHFIANMTPLLAQPACPNAATLQCLMWDGTSGGRVVPSGLYVYMLEGESKAYDGVVVVIR